MHPSRGHFSVLTSASPTLGLSIARRASASGGHRTLNPTPRSAKQPIRRRREGEMPGASAARPSWAILGRHPRVCAADTDLPPGADLALEVEPPPRVSLVSIPPRIFPDAATARNRPSILAADPSGLLVLCANKGRATRPFSVTCSGWTYGGWHDFNPGCYVLEAASASAIALPNADIVTDKDQVGIIRVPGGGGRYIVAELQPVVGRDRATLLCFSSDVGKWVLKDVRYPVPSRLWWPGGVISHYGRLWRIDLSFGLITCDPSVDAPVLAFVPLPSGKVLPYREAAGMRFVDMYRNRDARGGFKVSVWTLLDPDSTEWALEYEARFLDICADLPRKIPLLALIHPQNPAVVYFFLDNRLFAVDLVARTVVDCQVYELVLLPDDDVSTRFVHAWELPHALASGMKDQNEEGLSLQPSDTTNMG